MGSLAERLDARAPRRGAPRRASHAAASWVPLAFAILLATEFALPGCGVAPSSFLGAPDVVANSQGSDEGPARAPEALVEGARTQSPPGTPPQETAATPPRVSASQKGSVLVFPHVEARFNQDGLVVADTFLQISNDWIAGVRLATWFVTDVCTPHLAVIDLTKSQPSYWSAAMGKPFGLAPLGVLPGALRRDPATGERYVRGFFIAVAVDDQNRQVRWNHLSGRATYVDYARTDAWEYSPYAFQALVGDTGQPVGAPGVIRLDGVEYESGFDRLMLEYFAAGASAVAIGGVVATHDTLLTLLINEIDVRQEREKHCTKVQMQLWNEDEVGFTLDVCLCCWGTFRLSELAPVFRVETLGTQRGRAVFDGVASPGVCDVNPALPASKAVALLGVALKRIELSPAPLDAPAGLQVLGGAPSPIPILGAPARASAGTELSGQGNQSATIAFDVPLPPEEGGPTPLSSGAPEGGH